MSLQQALNSQRQKLGDRLGGNTVSGKVIIGILDTQNIGYNVVGADVLSNLSSISRLIDNLLDDEDISHDELGREICVDSKIDELRDFIFSLPENTRENFILAGKSAIEAMYYYNQDNNTGNREQEGVALANLYLCILDKDTLDIKKISFLVALFKASYMFCDLKDFKKDSKKLKEILNLFRGLVVNSINLFFYSQNKVKIIKHIFLAVIRSIKSSLSV